MNRFQVCKSGCTHTHNIWQRFNPYFGAQQSVVQNWISLIQSPSIFTQLKWAIHLVFSTEWIALNFQQSVLLKVEQVAHFWRCCRESWWWKVIPYGKKRPQNDDSFQMRKLDNISFFCSFSADVCLYITGISSRRVHLANSVFIIFMAVSLILTSKWITVFKEHHLAETNKQKSASEKNNNNKTFTVQQLNLLRQRQEKKHAECDHFN